MVRVAGMMAGQARKVARQWVLERGRRIPGLYGAYLAGSVNWLPDDAQLPPTSDLDINLVLSDQVQANGREKFLYCDLLLEATYLSIGQLQSPEAVLGDYHLAGGFRKPSILFDPSGHLTALQSVVEREFAQHRWVSRRCAHARDRVLKGLAALDEHGPLPDEVLGWLFPTGQTTHILLVAGLKNPTVRRRYAAVKELLAEYGHADLHELLLDLLGCTQMSRARVAQHLDTLARVFDAASAVIKTPFPFASDISALARPLAIDGSRELIEQGYHREAVFWIAVTYSRCLKVLQQDAPLAHSRFEPGYLRLLGDLEIMSFADLEHRRERVMRLLPRIWEVAEDIMATNPEIEE